VDTLPTQPSAYTEVMAEIEKQNASLARVGQIIGQDIGMAASILKLVNSSFFGFASHIANPTQAVNLLGVEVVKGLILTSHLFTLFDNRRFPGFTLENLVEHCLVAGQLARAIGELQGMGQKDTDDCFIAGMLHDVGKLVLASKFEAEYARVIAQVRERNVAVWGVEKEVFGTSHAEVGAYLLGLWGLPGPIVDAVAFHHAPSKARSTDLAVTAVHAANALEHELYVLNEGYAKNPLDTAHLAALGLSGRLPAWREACARICRKAP
jgi:putative nucleotidyltransferase with HDIG domain